MKQLDVLYFPLKDAVFSVRFTSFHVTMLICEYRGNKPQKDTVGSLEIRIQFNLVTENKATDSA